MGRWEEVGEKVDHFFMWMTFTNQTGLHRWSWTLQRPSFMESQWRQRKQLSRFKFCDKAETLWWTGDLTSVVEYRMVGLQPAHIRPGPAVSHGSGGVISGGQREPWVQAKTMGDYAIWEGGLEKQNERMQLKRPHRDSCEWLHRLRPKVNSTVLGIRSQRRSKRWVKKQNTV